MLSQYTWGQFFLFTVVVLALYYLVVGLMYYRDDFSAILKGKKPAGPQLAGAGTSAAGPPALVRVKSAFVASPTATESAATESAAEAAAAKEMPESGAATNLAEASTVVVGGELPSSTATATGRDDSMDNEGPMDAASSVSGATDEALAMDADREELEDRPNAELAALILQKAQNVQPSQSSDGSDEEQADNPVSPTAKINTDDADIENKRTLVGENYVDPENVYQPVVASSYEPLDNFDLPFASPFDVAPAQEEEMYPMEDVAAYIDSIQAGEKPSLPTELMGTSFEDELSHNTTANTNELASLFGNDE